MIGNEIWPYTEKLKFPSMYLLYWISIWKAKTRKQTTISGPTSESSDESNESFQFPPLQGNLSMVHYNDQSFANKIDIIEPELTDFDIISLTETWLNDSISNEDLKFNEFQAPFRRDRIGDSHDGIMVYVKKDIPCKRRIDLELVNIECLWIDVYAKTK